nr:phosphatidylcholine transfer protein [Ciona intestinalis]|eukprot:XP_018669162.1 phosphatidylcholine transfer protein [Ciona intestinalis]
MIKLQVLKFMGILTIMKLGVFAVSALSLLIALTWVLVYCPVGIMKANTVIHRANVHSAGDRMKLEDYFDHYEDELNQDLKKFKADGKPVEYMEKGNKKHNNAEVVIPRKLWNDDVFDSMIHQLDHKELDGYEFLAESMNVTIYRTPKGNAGLYDYKLYATLPDASPEEIASVFLDNKYRVVWDEYVTELYVVQKNEKGPDVIYFNVDFPWPLSNRYVYGRETRRMTKNGEEFVVIVMHSVLKHNVPEVSGAIRVDDYHQSLALGKWGDHGTRAFIQYYDNPKGSVPSWLVNWAAKTGVPAFMKDLQRACKGLPKFLAEQKRKSQVV